MIICDNCNNYTPDMSGVDDGMVETCWKYRDGSLTPNYINDRMDGKQLKCKYFKEL